MSGGLGATGLNVGSGLGGADLGGSGLFSSSGDTSFWSYTVRLTYPDRNQVVRALYPGTGPYDNGLAAALDLPDADMESREHYPGASAAAKNAYTSTNLAAAGTGTQTISVTAGRQYLVVATGTYSYTLSGVCSGTLVGAGQTRVRHCMAGSTGDLIITATTPGDTLDVQDSTDYPNPLRPMRLVPIVGAAPTSQCYFDANVFGNLT